MKRFIYEWEDISTSDWGMDYWEAKTFRTAKAEIFALYEDDVDGIRIKFIAEIKYETD